MFTNSYSIIHRSIAAPWKIASKSLSHDLKVQHTNPLYIYISSLHHVNVAVEKKGLNGNSTGVFEKCNGKSETWPYFENLLPNPETNNDDQLFYIANRIFKGPTQFLYSKMSRTAFCILTTRKPYSFCNRILFLFERQVSQHQHKNMHFFIVL